MHVVLRITVQYHTHTHTHRFRIFIDLLLRNTLVAIFKNIFERVSS